LHTLHSEVTSLSISSTQQPGAPHHHTTTTTDSTGGGGSIQEFGTTPTPHSDGAAVNVGSHGKLIGGSSAQGDGSSSSSSSSNAGLAARQAALEQRVADYGKVLQAMRNRIVALQVRMTDWGWAVGAVSLGGWQLRGQGAASHALPHYKV